MSSPDSNPNINPGELFGGKLTARQREVVQLVAEGLPAKQIAFRLNISAKTVEFHKAAVMQQLGFHSTAELIRFAVETGIVHKYCFPGWWRPVVVLTSEVAMTRRGKHLSFGSVDGRTTSRLMARADVRTVSARI